MRTDRAAQGRVIEEKKIWQAFERRAGRCLGGNVLKTLDQNSVLPIEILLIDKNNDIESMMGEIERCQSLFDFISVKLY
ncbi:hypothetical protein [Tumebacillus lipolyticus]|uniref:Uncharacterized protein n=1 Tax=Tumebacillus lipolyticus TaxID=1280370 RepID=A0ABW4ZU64_9BACL